MRRTLLCGPRDAARLLCLSKRAGHWPEVSHDLAGIPGGILVAFNTGVIVPADILAQYDRAYNFHAAPPEYPGRDPHHWAVYDGVTEYGVTAHEMVAKVDAGPILAVDRFRIHEGATPQALKIMATEKLFGLFERIIGHMFFAPINVQWSGTVRKRKDIEGLVNRDRSDRAIMAAEGFG